MLHDGATRADEVIDSLDRVARDAPVGHTKLRLVIRVGAKSRHNVIKVVAQGGV